MTTNGSAIVQCAGCLRHWHPTQRPGPQNPSERSRSESDVKATSQQRPDKGRGGSDRARAGGPLQTPGIPPARREPTAQADAARGAKQSPVGTPLEPKRRPGDGGNKDARRRSGRRSPQHAAPGGCKADIVRHPRTGRNDRLAIGAKQIRHRNTSRRRSSKTTLDTSPTTRDAGEQMGAVCPRMGRIAWRGRAERLAESRPAPAARDAAQTSLAMQRPREDITSRSGNGFRRRAVGNGE